MPCILDIAVCILVYATGTLQPHVAQLNPDPQKILSFLTLAPPTLQGKIFGLLSSVLNV